MVRSSQCLSALLLPTHSPIGMVAVKEAIGHEVHVRRSKSGAINFDFG